MTNPYCSLFSLKCKLVNEGCLSFWYYTWRVHDDAEFVGRNRRKADGEGLDWLVRQPKAARSKGLPYF
ncbi:hypothetical protein QUF75_01670 [Desulfococcaceae bacterium HSG7]|nr:hypothetical protein [Desulfococcaceae bacterium HSG9]MDM8553421.1 hypothetical protein [Desulfococcaceae bacterium HSG7]